MLLEEEGVRLREQGEEAARQQAEDRKCRLSEEADAEIMGSLNLTAERLAEENESLRAKRKRREEDLEGPASAIAVNVKTEDCEDELWDAVTKTRNKVKVMQDRV